MDRLTPREEELMRILWKLKKAFVKDIIAELPEPKPHYNTVSTIIRKMEKKGFVKHKAFGKTHQYFPAIDKKNFRKAVIQEAIKNYFDNSYKNVVSFLVKERKLSAKELKEILDLIEKNNKE